MRTARKLLWAAPLLLSACASVDVHTDYDPSVDFSRYSSYYWKKLPETDNPLMRDRIVAAVDDQLQAKGWRKVPEDQAQTALAAHVTAREGQRVDTQYDSWGPGWRGWGGGPVMSTSRVVTYTVGTLVVDMFDAKSRNAIWRGTASDTVSSDPAVNRKALEEGIRGMFATFPPGVPATSRH